MVAPLALRVATCSHAHKSTAAAAAEERGIIIILFVLTGSDPSLGTGSLREPEGDTGYAPRRAAWNLGGLHFLYLAWCFFCLDLLEPDTRHSTTRNRRFMQRVGELLPSGTRAGYLAVQGHSIHIDPAFMLPTESGKNSGDRRVRELPVQ